MAKRSILLIGIILCSFLVFSQQPSIIIDSPSLAGGITQAGWTIPIAWRTVGITGNVRIVLRKSDNSKGYPIRESIPHNSSPVNYTIPDSIPAGEYFIRIRQRDVKADSVIFRIKFIPLARILPPDQGEKISDSIGARLSSPLMHIRDITPRHGVEGTIIELTGSRFGSSQGDFKIMMKQSQSTMVFRRPALEWTSTRIRVQIPYHGWSTPGPYNFYIVTADKKPISNPIRFEMERPGVIVRVRNRFLRTETLLEVRGSDFGVSTGKEIVIEKSGDIHVLSFKSWDNNTIECFLPKEAYRGGWNIYTRHKSEFNRGNLSNKFWINVEPYIEEVTPTTGPFPQGSRIALKGRHFGNTRDEGDVFISGPGVAGHNLGVTSWSNSLITAIIDVDLVRPVRTGRQNFNRYEMYLIVKTDRRSGNNYRYRGNSVYLWVTGH